MQRVGSDLLLGFGTLCELATDDASVIKSLQEANRRVYGHIVEEIRTRSKDFLVVDFAHEGRLSNIDAHITYVEANVTSEIARHVWLLSPSVGFVSPLVNSMNIEF